MTDEYREHPAPGLACVWTSAGTRITRVLPDACVDLIWRRGHGAFVARPDTTAHVTTSEADDVLVGARFAPGTGEGALGVPLHVLRDARIPLDELRPDLADALPADLDPAQALRRLHAARELVAAETPQADPLVAAAVAALTDPRRRVAALAGELGLSERQLRRRLDAAVGYGPKVLQRVLHLQRLLAGAEREPRTDLARRAADAGYADQAHLTHDCVRLSGLPPAALLAERSASA